MRVLLANLTAHPVIGGVETSLRYIGRELLRKGHEVAVFCFAGPGERPSRSEVDGVTILRSVYDPPRWPHTRTRYQVDKTKTQILPVLQDFRPEAVWSRSAPIGLGIAQSGFEGPILQVFSTTARMDCHGLYFNTRGVPFGRRLKLLALYPLAYRASRWVDREVVSRATPVVFSDMMRSQICSDYEVDPSAVTVCPPGVDTEVFSVEKGNSQLPTLAEKFGLAPDEPSILYVGRLWRGKNIDFLIDSYKVLRDRARLILIGSGPDEASLRRKVEREGLKENVLFAGVQSDLLPGFYAQARVCVLPSIVESFGQSFLESLACGTPVVGFASDGRSILTATAEIVRDPDTGVIVRVVDPQSFARGVARILDLDEKSYNAMSKTCVEDVKTRFTWSRFVDTLLDISKGRRS